MAAFGAAIRDLFRFSKQFQKECSAKLNFRSTGFSEVRSLRLHL
jgi:hypothetical protein